MRERGFTLIELLCVIVIIGLLASLAVVAYVDHLRRAKVRVTRAALSTLALQIQSFYLDRSHFPETLDELSRGRYVDRVPRDGWDRAFVYRAPGSRRGDFDVLSLGEDGREGTPDDIVHCLDE